MSKPLISILVGAAKNNVIGYQGDMPWKVSADLKNFKKITMGKPIIMGRKTFDSIGRPLPGRRNMVITRNINWAAKDVDIFADLDAAINAAGDCEEAIVIGGGELYKLALPMAKRIYLTAIHATPEGDTWFPDLNEADWEVAHKADLPQIETDTNTATFKVLERKISSN